MATYDEIYLSKRPQHLCHMCGKCCRVVTASVSYSELCKKAGAGDKGAKEFLSLFVPYESVEAARQVDAEVVDNIIARLSEDGNCTDTVFYYCKYLGSDNLCSRYETRLDLCKHCPCTPWSIVPPGCGFEGWLFWQREEIKKKVRGYKEELIELKLLRMKTHDKETLRRITAVEQKLHKNIGMYKKYGSEDW